jgi:tRNA1Val (adenine37-N6)-methyltransferase
MKVGTDAVLLGCFANVQGCSALEIGCGCGVISLMLAQRFPNLKITAIDIHKPSVDEAFENFKNNIWNDRLNVEHKSLQEFSEICSTKYDAIVSNPPFFSKSLQSPDSDRTNTRHTTTLTYDDLTFYAEKLLTQKGKFSTIIPTLELTNFQNSISKSNLQIHQILHIFGVDGENSKRVILECGFEKKNLTEKQFLLHNTCRGEARLLSEVEACLALAQNPHNYSDEYFELTKDFLLFNQPK